MKLTNLDHYVTAKRLTVAKLSDKAGIPPDRLDAIRSGAEVSLGELRQLASALSIRMEDLFTADPKTPTSEFLYRSTASSRKKPDPSLISTLSRKLDLSLGLLKNAADTEDVRAHFMKAETYADAEENAAKFRNLFFRDDQASPLLRLPQILVDALDVLLFLVDAPTIDGASAIIEGKSFIFVSRRFEGRMLFTLAHELAHILSHHSSAEDFFVLDAAEPEGASNASLKRRKNELYAHAFASCLLMPKIGVGIALKKIREKSSASGPLGDVEVLLLSRIFGVSFVAAARRCEDLKLLPRGGANSLNEWLKKEFGSAEKRAEMAGLPPRPKVEFPSIPRALIGSAIQQIKNGSMSIGRAASELGLSIFDLLDANELLVH